MEGSFVKQNVLQRRVSKLLNKSVEIAFLFMSFKRLRLEREQIRQILLA